MNYSNNCDIGKLGENAAHTYLIDKGYEIICKNYRVRRGEIDIIARDGDVLVFFEVKTRNNDKFGPIISQISEKKANTIYRIAEEYIVNVLKRETDCRVDIICISMDGKNDVKSLEHFENVYTLM